MVGFTRIRAHVRRRSHWWAFYQNKDSHEVVSLVGFTKNKDPCEAILTLALILVINPKHKEAV